MSTPTLGLRERKRVETRARLEKAAVSISLELGIDHATVEAISERADVSPRTFFNYFASKEDAVLGIRDFEVTPQELAEYALTENCPDAVSAVVRALFHLIGPSISDTAAHQSRIEAIRRFPHLMSRQFAHMTKMTGQLTETVQLILTDDPRWTGSVDAASSEMLLGLCLSAVRVAVREWIDNGSVGTPEDLENRTLSLIHQLTERIA